MPPGTRLNLAGEVGSRGDFKEVLMRPSTWYFARYEPGLISGILFLLLWTSYFLVAGCILAGRAILGRGNEGW